MSYQVLARKWRPRDFTTLVGQEHVVRALTHALEQQRLHHAYLFTGTRGVGKTTLSRILAKALNCTGEDGNGGITAQPCGVCKACTEIDAGRFVDYIEMDAASNRGVDEMAQLLDKAVYAPTVGRFKVYMIDEVHMLTNHAFNAMLKTLEEPPAHVKFILATTDPQKIPVTVLSRCLQFNLKQMPPGHIVGHLEGILAAEGIASEGNALRLLAQAASGSMRDALSLTDQAIAYSAGEVSEAAVRGMLGAIDQRYLVQLLDALAAEDGAGMLAVADSMADRSLSFAGALQDLGSLLHKIALAQAVPASVQEDWPEAADIRRLAEAFDAQEVQLFYQMANLGRSELALAPDEYAGFTMTLLRMLAFRPANLPPDGVPPGPARAGTASGMGAGAASGPGAARSGSRPAMVAAVAAPSAAAPTAAAPTAAAPTAAAPTAAASSAAAPSVAESAPQPSPLERSSTAPRIDAPPAARAVPAAVAPSMSAPSASPPSTSASSAGSTAAAEAPSAAPAAERPLSPARAALAAARQASAARTGRAGAPAPASASASAPAPAPAAPAAQQRPVPGPFAASPATSSATPSSRPSSAPPSAPASAPSPRPIGPGAGPKPAAPQNAAPVPARPTPAARKSAAPANDEPPPWESAGGSDVPPWESLPPDLPVFGPDDYDSEPVRMAAPMARPSPRAAAVTTAPAAGQSSERQPVSAAPPVQVVSSGPASPASTGGKPIFSGDWPALAATLPLKGLSGQLAHQTELARVEGATFVLRAPVAAIAEGGAVERLAQALSEHFGTAVRVQCEIGAVSETAAAADAQARAERQRAAEEVIENDPFVQGLLHEFGGQIVPGSIQPRAL